MSKLITVSENLLKDILPLLKGAPLEKEVTDLYDNYKGDKFGRILAYVIINGKDVSMELAKSGMAQVIVYQHKRPFIYQDQLLKLQDEAKQNKLGIWSQ